MEIVKLFSKLRVKEGFELVAYVFRSDMGGNGVVWAVPEGCFPDVEECEKLDDALGAPKPAAPSHRSALLRWTTLRNPTSRIQFLSGRFWSSGHTGTA
ncbi:MAG: hypothetical protein H0Z19_10900 [Archaeoglobus sp.]|uniref:hypothetical protein n=1 Tax=Archaeoglobus sp. TaxID=1872626 RepID=UPI001DF8A1AB|nr:hypothetical protein [Archaeoglobus sp.]MBO8180960.1 hypothetical protein [Archaeoglobus sp.]